MKLVLFLAADYANITSDGKLNVMGIFRGINAATFPARHPSMYLVIKLEPELGEYGQTRDLNIKFINPDGKELMGFKAPVEIPQGVVGVRPEVNVLWELKDVIFPEEGPYQFVVLIDKDHKGDMQIMISKLETANQD